MTSKRCFFKIMWEDFRHKKWMLVLSILGNLLAMPVTFMLSTGAAGYYIDDSTNAWLFRKAADMCSFFVGPLCIMGGLIAGVGALIVGFASFRYLFHRNMVDNYHSMPVKRRTLFVAGWLNGFLIWFIPFVIFFTITVIMGVTQLGQLRAEYMAGTNLDALITRNFEQLTVGKLVGDALLSAVSLLVAFLLIYHLVLVAVMLSGNVLNSMMLSGVMGIGVIALYALVDSFRMVYFNTYVPGVGGVAEKLMYASPAVSSIYLLSSRSELAYGEPGFGICFAVNLVIALLLGVVALFLYLKRSSELAETGVRNKPVCFAVQILTAFGAGMSGWIFFYALTGDWAGNGAAELWAVFGALLVGILVFGVMDIIFRMEFRAFFSHKLLMLATMASVLVTGFCFSQDWLGYDTYLPAKEKIAELSVMAPDRNSLQNYYYNDVSALRDMHYTDTDAIYDFLETAVEDQKWIDGVRASGVDERTDNNVRGEEILTKVTLQNGRSYYRSYYVYNDDVEAALRILSSKEYTDAYYRVPEQTVAEATGVSFSRDYMSHQLEIGTKQTRESFGKLIDAYNKDLEEQPELFICEGSRILARIGISANDRQQRRQLVVYEEMTHTREALREWGYGEFADTINPEDVERLEIYMGLWYSEMIAEGIDPVEYAREHFEVYGGTGEFNEQTVVEYYNGTEFVYPEDAEQYIKAVDTKDEQIILKITDREEIAELLELLSYTDAYRYSGGAFGRELSGRVDVIMKDETEFTGMLYGGTLPEKYVIRFGEIEFDHMTE